MFLIWFTDPAYLRPFLGQSYEGPIRQVPSRPPRVYGVDGKDGQQAKIGVDTFDKSERHLALSPTSEKKKALHHWNSGIHHGGRSTCGVVRTRRVAPAKGDQRQGCFAERIFAPGSPMGFGAPTIDGQCLVQGALGAGLIHGGTGCALLHPHRGGRIFGFDRARSIFPSLLANLCFLVARESEIACSCAPAPSVLRKPTSRDPRGRGGRDGPAAPPPP